MSEGISLNVCEACMLKCTPNDRIRGNGDIITSTLKNAPKSIYQNLRDLALSPNKEMNLFSRAKDAKFSVLKLAKNR